MAKDRMAKRRAPISERQVEMMLLVLIRRENALQHAQALLQPETFAPHHRCYAVIWSVVLDHYESINVMPGEEAIIGEIERRMAEDPDAISEEEEEVIDLFLRRAFYMDEDDLCETTAFSYLKMYLQDRLISDLRSDVENANYIPSDVFALLSQNVEMAGEIDSMEPKALLGPFPDGWNQEELAVPKTETPLEFMNRMMSGGAAPGEVIGLLGPAGSCKSTIGIQFTVGLAAKFGKQWRDSDRTGPLKLCYLFIYEGTLNEFRLRSLSYLGMVDRTALELGDRSALSNDDQLKPYEQRMFALAISEGSPVEGENTRCERASNELQETLRLIDMTGNDPDHPGRGGGLTTEIAGIIANDQAHYKRQGIDVEVGSVTIDYVGAAVERAIDMQSGSHDQTLRHYVSKFPLHLKNKIAIRFETIVFALHQFSGKANSFRPGKIPQGTDAAEAKNFRDNFDFLFCIGKPNSENCCVFVMDKHRRAPNQAEIVLRIRGALGRVDHAPDMLVDKGRGVICSVEAMHRIREESDQGEDDDNDDEYTRDISPDGFDEDAQNEIVRSASNSR